MFLEALKGENFSRPPVWLMRQAGRYLPEYQSYREKCSLKKLFFTADTIVEITLLPIEKIGVDAAILFSDITIIAPALGLKLDFPKGPRVFGTYQKLTLEPLEPIFQAIRRIKKQSKVPLIGFCGGPFSVSRYFPPHPDALERITEANIAYIKEQEKAGVDAIQIFDTWGYRIGKEEFSDYAQRYLKRIVESVRIPVIAFMRKTFKGVEALKKLPLAAISFDWERPLFSMREKFPGALQGNLNPDLLYQPNKTIEKEVKALVTSMRKDPGFIVNLGHGIKPDMRVDAVKTFVDAVRNG